MSELLPTADQLSRLPLRAVVAYAARIARRLSVEISEVVDHDILSDALSQIDTVSHYTELAHINLTGLLNAAAKVAAAYAESPVEKHSTLRFRVVFSICHAALAAMNTLLFVRDGERQAYVISTCREAERVSHAIRFLDQPASQVLKKAALADFETLARHYGSGIGHCVGAPVNCFHL